MASDSNESTKTLIAGPEHRLDRRCAALEFIEVDNGVELIEIHCITLQALKRGFELRSHPVTIVTKRLAGDEEG